MYIFVNDIDIFIDYEYFFNLPSLHVSHLHPRWHPFVGHIPVILKIIFESLVLYCIPS
jgi:hypothetical protein